MTNPTLSARAASRAALADPTQYPPEFLSWLARFISDNALVRTKGGGVSASPVFARASYYENNVVVPTNTNTQASWTYVGGTGQTALFDMTNPGSPAATSEGDYGFTMWTRSHSSIANYAFSANIDVNCNAGASGFAASQFPLDGAGESPGPYGSVSIIWHMKAGDTFDGQCKHVAGVNITFDRYMYVVKLSSATGDAEGALAPNMVALWQGQDIPSSPGYGSVWRIPRVAALVVTFILSKMSVYVLNVGGSAGQFITEKSTDGSVWTTIATVNLAAGQHAATTVSGPLTVTSGDYVRLNWAALPTGASIWTVELEGTST
jgi:hypothetical protein